MEIPTAKDRLGLNRANPEVWTILTSAKLRSSKSKYHNQKTNGFDSKKEARRAEELRMLEKYGRISNLQYQVPFLLQEGFRDKTGQWHKPIHYIADFVYIQDGKEIVEDTKSPIIKKNPVYRLKKKLLLYKYPDLNFSDEI